MIAIITPHFPVLVTSKNMEHGQAIMVTDYGPEQNKIWTVVMDKSGEVWDVPNPEIRFRKNWTMGRRI